MARVFTSVLSAGHYPRAPFPTRRRSGSAGPLERSYGETMILDWKTGRPDPAKHQRQMLAYAAWAENNLDAPAGTIRCILAYLRPGYEEVEAVPTEAELDALAAEVSADIQQMKALCLDPEQNVPLEKEQFPMTEQLGYCRHCQYRKLCDRVDVGSEAS